MSVSLILEQLPDRRMLAMLNFVAAGSWFAPQNWQPRRLPAVIDSVLIRNDAALVDASTTVASLSLGNSNTTKLTIQKDLSSKSILIGSTGQKNGLVVQSEGTVSSGSIELGRDANTTGRWLLQGGTLQANSFSVGRVGHGGVSVTDGTLRTNNLTIGLAKTGSFFNLHQGQVLVTANIQVGSASAGNGTLQIGGGNFSWGGKLTLHSGSTLSLLDDDAHRRWVGNKAGQVAMELRGDSTLRFQLKDNAFDPLQLASGRLTLTTTSKFIVDLSEFELTSEAAQIPLVQFGSMTGKVNPRQVRYLLPDGLRAELITTTKSLELRVLRSDTAPPASTQLHTAYTFTPAAAQDYIYAPSLMYDETEGLWKVWFCFHDKTVQGGDNIGYREHPLLEGLAQVPTTVALPPSLVPTQFDQLHVCDPTVYRDPASDDYFMLYGANTDGKQLAVMTRIGLATSEDGGRTFRNRNTQPLLVSENFQGGYGVGQPSVTLAEDGYFYMIYTDAPGGSIPHKLVVVRSQTPDFASREYVTSIFTDVTNGLTVDLLYDPVRNAFAVISNSTPISTRIGINHVRIVWYSANWQQLEIEDWRLDRMPFSIGEGPALAGTATRQWRETTYPSLLSGSISAASRSRDEWAYWVRGGLVGFTVRRTL